ncbi:MAG: T9SS type A sorting domain-containing protein [Prevotellaceae bacterium]|jgi:1,4-alpha-glucan branching enzyme|nr:T9SS type A sorting domain-containing protein [Prevotellaceae bacterium]
MRKIFTLSILLICSALLTCQVVTCNPSFITNDYNGIVEVIFDATQGNGGLNNYTGDVYAHTGVITTASTNNSDWKHAPAWGDNSAKYKLTRLTGENNKYSLLITPNISAYYGLQTGEVVTKLAFVFRSADKTKEGKDAGNADIFVPIYESGLNVKFDTPENDQLSNINSTINFSISASSAAELKLFINNQQKKVENSAQTLTFSQTFSEAGDYLCVAQANLNGQTVKDTVNICVTGNSANVAMPAGLQAGVNYDATDPTKVTLVLYEKDKSNTLPDNVLVVGDFNDWTYSNDYQMKRDGTTGNWWLTLENLTPQQEYAFQYAVKTDDNVVKISDAYAEKILDGWNDKYIAPYIYPDLKNYPAGKTDGLVSVFQTQKPAFQWSQQTLNFQPADKNNLVIYELWIHDYSTYRSANEIVNRLDYLESLGVNAIELMPIVEFDGNISWGYNPNHHFAADKAYGTPDAYKTLIDECHKRGIAVILDMVFNHATGNNPFAKLYWDGTTNNVLAQNPYFNVTAPHADNVFHDFNHDFQGTRDYFKRVLQYWLNEYKIDGYRMDLTKGICGENCNNRVAIINEYYDAVKAAKDDAYFILEHWVSSEEQDFVNAGMLCWGGGNAMNESYSQLAMGWLNNDNISSANKKGWVYFAESHDEERNFYTAKTWGNGNLPTDEVARLSRVPLNVAFNVLLQGPKMLWQFEELGFDFSIDSNGGRTDPKPVPEDDTLRWFQNDLRMSAYNKIAKLINLRTQIKPNVFINGTTSINVGSGLSVRTIQWEHNGIKILAVGNFNVSGGTQYTGSQTCTMPAGTWYNYLNNNTQQNGNTTITLQPGELLVFTNDNSIIAPNDKNFNYTADYEDILTNKTDIYIYPTLVNNKIYIRTDEQIRNVQIISLRGGAARMYFNNKLEIDATDLQKGMYLVVVTTDKHQQAQKILKQ